VQVLQAWILFPALLALLSLGWGLLVEWLSRARLSGFLLLPVGFAALVVVTRAAMWLDFTAGLGAPLAAVGAVAGLALGLKRVRSPRLDRWAAGAALAVFVVFAAPIVLSGEATFAGYTVLGDTAVHFVLVDHIGSHGTDLAGLPPSSYRSTLEAYFASGYPLGSHAALAAGRQLAFLDVAWAFQPFLAFVAAMLALTLAGLLRGIVRSPWRRGAIAAVAAQPALVYSYAMQGSIKEIVTLWLVPLLAALVAELAIAPGRAEDARFRLSQALPLAVASAAAVAAIGVAAGAWLAPMLLVALVLVFRREGSSWSRTGIMAAGFAAVVAVISLPTLLDSADYLDVTREVVTTQEEFGNLLGPLDVAQVFGLWLEGDFRVQPPPGPGIDKQGVTWALIGVAAASGVLGLLWLLRRRSLGPLLFVAVSIVALAYVLRTGSPWADGKALAIAAPAFLLAALLGPLALEARGARLEALMLGLVLAVGVVSSNAFVYHDVSLAPRDRLEELEELGERAEDAGASPLLYTEFEEMGKHFLRDAEPVGAAEAFSVPGLTPGLRAGGGAPFGYPVDIGDLEPADVRRFGALALRRSPDGGRPPAGYGLAWRGRYYELWTREGGGSPGAPARPVAELATADEELPGGWAPRTDDPSLVQTVGPGTVEGRVRVPRDGAYDIWLRGSFGRDVEVLIDGRSVGAVGDQLAQPAEWVAVTRESLEAGTHEVALIREGGDLSPGNGDGPRTLGSLVLTPARGPES
jgi:hypothetical protein